MNQEQTLGQDLADIQAAINFVALSAGLDPDAHPIVSTAYPAATPVQTTTLPMPVPTASVAPTDTLAKTVEWFSKAVPNPEDANMQTQLGVHMEEFHEMLVCLHSPDITGNALLKAARGIIKQLADYTKASSGNDKTLKNIVVHPGGTVEFLDSLCDQIVTAAGCAHMHRMQIVPALAEVNRSNFSKFDAQGNPIFNSQMKVIKGPDYTKPDLKPFI